LSRRIHPAHGALIQIGESLRKVSKLNAVLNRSNAAARENVRKRWMSPSNARASGESDNE